MELSPLVMHSVLRAAAATQTGDDGSLNGNDSGLGSTAITPAPQPSGSDVLQTSATLYFPMLLVAWLAFELLRRHATHIFERADHFFELPLQLRGVGAWIPMLFTVQDRDIVHRCGLDAWVFLRFVRLSQKIAGLAVLCSLVLFPLYASGASLDLPMDDDDGVPAPQRNMESFDRLSIANVDAAGRWRLWFSVATAYAVSLLVMVLVNKEYAAYMHARHDMMAHPDAQQYSVVVTDLPRRLRQPQQLLNYMEYLFPGAIYSVYVGVECGTLEKLLEERHKVQLRLDSMVAQLHVDETSASTNVQRPQITIDRRWLCGSGTRVDAIEHYGQQLETIDKAIQTERAAIKDRQNQVLGGATYGAINAASAVVGTLRGISAANEQDDAADSSRSLTTQGSTALRGESARLLSGGSMRTIDPPKRRRPLLQRLHDFARLAIESVVGKPLGTQPAIMRSAAFIGFRSLKAAHAAQQLLQTENPVKLRIHAAPHLHDIKWENFGLPDRLKSTWRLLAACLTFLIVCFWTIPTAFVTSLANVQKLRVTYPFWDTLITDHAWVQKSLEQVAPLLLSVMNALAKVIFKLLAEREGHLSNAEIDASTFNKLCYFQVFQMFFVSAVTGSIIAQLFALVDQPSRVLYFLGSSIASQSMLFITFIIVQICVSLPLLWLRVVPVLKDKLHKLLAPTFAQLPERQPWLGLVPLNFEPDIDPAMALAQQFLIFLLVLVFAPIAPIVAYVALLFFLCAEVVYRRHYFFVNDAKWAPIQSTGAFWPPLFTFIVGALYIAQFTLIGLLSLKSASIMQLLAAGLMPFATFIFHWYVTTLCGYPHAAMHLPLDRCCDLDEERKNQPVEFLEGVYQQPAMAKSLTLPSAAASATAKSATA